MKTRFAAVVIAIFAAHAWAKLPTPPPLDPAKAEEAKVKDAEAKVKDAEAKLKAAELQAKYEDKAVASYAAKAQAAGKEFKPQLGNGIQPPPPAAAAPLAAAAAPVAATPAPAAAPKAAPPTAAKK